MNSPTVKEISPDEYTFWFAQKRLLLQGRTPFHQPTWLQAAAKGSGYDVVIIGVYDQGHMVAAIPGFLKRIGPVKLFGSPLRGIMSPYLGPIGFGLTDSPNDLALLLALCSSFAREKWGVAYAEFGLRESSDVTQTNMGLTWERGTWTSYVLDLTQGQEAIWAGTQTRFRRHVRKSGRLGLKIVPMRDARRYCQMQNETMGRRGTKGWHTELFYRTVLEEISDESIWALGVEYQGNVIAAGIFLHDDHEVHYLSGASLTEYRSLPTSYLLHWHIVGSAVSAGLRVYDLGGRPTDNVDLFKKSLSPQVATHTYFSEASHYVRYARDIVLSSLPLARKIKSWLPSHS